MKKHLLLIAFIIFTVALPDLNAQGQCPAGRYRDRIFPNPTPTTVIYDHDALKFDGSTQNLTMDIFQPPGDNFAHRPLIILAFGGSFTSGTKYSPDIYQLCGEFARRGYVTASLEYRIGKENGDDTAMYKAVIRGLQDMDKAIRFFCVDAATTNKYRIDPSQIWIGGTSAGGFIGLNLGYFSLNSSKPMPEGMFDILIGLGGVFQGVPGSPGYGAPVKGIINLCGAVLDTAWIRPGDPIVVAVHGTEDETVPHQFDSIKAANDIKARFFGSADIDRRCNNIGLNHSVYLFQGADHVPFVLPIPFLPPASLYMDTTIQVVRDFLYANTICDATLVSGINGIDYQLPVTLMPNVTDGLFEISSRYESILTAEIYSIDGKLVMSSYIEPNSIATFPGNDLGKGMFLVQLTDKNNSAIRKTEKVVVY